MLTAYYPKEELNFGSSAENKQTSDKRPITSIACDLHASALPPVTDLLCLNLHSIYVWKLSSQKR